MSVVTTRAMAKATRAEIKQAMIEQEAIANYYLQDCVRDALKAVCLRH